MATVRTSSRSIIESKRHALLWVRGVWLWHNLVLGTRREEAAGCGEVQEHQSTKFTAARNTFSHTHTHILVHTRQMPLIFSFKSHIHTHTRTHGIPSASTNTILRVSATSPNARCCSEHTFQQHRCSGPVPLGPKSHLGGGRKKTQTKLGSVLLFKKKLINK